MCIYMYLHNNVQGFDVFLFHYRHPVLPVLHVAAKIVEAEDGSYICRARSSF